MAASLVVLVLFALAGLFVQRRLATVDAVEEAKDYTELAGRGIVAPALTDAALAGEPEAFARLDELVRQKVLGDRVVRVKIWSPAGRILYSDEPRLVGATYPLDEEDQEALRTGATDAELSDLSRPENRFERRSGKLLEVYVPLLTTGGRPVLYEAYQPFHHVSADSRRLLLAFAPPLLAALVLLWLTQAPLAWSMARRLRAGQRERENLLRGAIEATRRERRRIAADLHDGVVQQLAGTAFTLAAAAGSVSTAPPRETGQAIDEGVAGVRQAMHQLRSLIVEIHPPSLRSGGLAAALSDLVGLLSDHGIAVRMDVPPGLRLSTDVEELLYRGAQEAVRNVAAHSGASRVAIRLETDGRSACITVDDDGCGFSDDDRAQEEREGHVGLSLVGELAADAGGVLEVRSTPGAGTSVRLEVPCG